ncbi:hypothetical protein BJ742DRAFT_891363 [Cladochytrium replicatum]|nr:hypothetical protein BJ742DRAFT_891363 [Cladochytrium replicatum]
MTTTYGSPSPFGEPSTHTPGTQAGTYSGAETTPLHMQSSQQSSAGPSTGAVGTPIGQGHGSSAGIQSGGITIQAEQGGGTMGTNGGSSGSGSTTPGMQSGEQGATQRSAGAGSLGAQDFRAQLPHLTSVFVTGATGSLGATVLKEMKRQLFQNKVNIVVGAHYSGTEMDERNQTMQNWLERDFHHVCRIDAADSNTLDFRGIDVLLIIPSNDQYRVRHVQNYVRAAEQWGVKYIVLVSVIGSEDGNIEFTNEFREMEVLVENTTISCTFLRTYWWIDNLFLETHSICENSTIILPMSEDSHISPVCIEDVSKAICAILQNPELHRNIAYDLTGPQSLTGRQLAEEASRGLRRMIEFQPVDVQTYASELVQFGGAPEWLAYNGGQYLALLASPKYAILKPTYGFFQKLTGHYGTSAHEWFQRYQGDFPSMGGGEEGTGIGRGRHGRKLRELPMDAVLLNVGETRGILELLKELVVDREQWLRFHREFVNEEDDRIRRLSDLIRSKVMPISNRLELEQQQQQLQQQQTQQTPTAQAQGVAETKSTKTDLHIPLSQQAHAQPYRIAQEGTSGGGRMIGGGTQQPYGVGIGQGQPSGLEMGQEQQTLGVGISEQQPSGIGFSQQHQPFQPSGLGIGISHLPSGVGIGQQHPSGHGLIQQPSGVPMGQKQSSSTSATGQQPASTGMGTGKPMQTSTAGLGQTQPTGTLSVGAGTVGSTPSVRPTPESTTQQQQPSAAPALPQRSSLTGSGTQQTPSETTSQTTQQPEGSVGPFPGPGFEHGTSKPTLFERIGDFVTGGSTAGHQHGGEVGTDGDMYRKGFAL